MTIKNYLKLFLILLLFNSQLWTQNVNLYLPNNYLPEQEINIKSYVYNAKSKYITLKLYKIEYFIKFSQKINIDRNKTKDVLEFIEKNSELFKSITEVQDRIYPDNNGYATYDKNLGKLSKPGTYLLYAGVGDNSAVKVFTVSELAWILKKSEDRVLIYITNRKTSEPVTADIQILNTNNSVFNYSTDKRGICDIKNKAILNSDSLWLVIKSSKDECSASNYNLNIGNYVEKYKVYTYTNQPVYRPGLKVSFKSIIRKYEDLELQPFTNNEVNVTIKNSRDEKVYSKILKTNKYGSIADEFVLSENAKLGEYNIILEIDGQSFYSNFYVEEYKKPEYKVEVITDKSQYSNDDIIKGKIKADYYFGSPVTNARVEYEIYKVRFFRPWWYFDEYSWIYKRYFWNDYFYGYDEELVYEDAGELDEKGIFEFEYKIDKNETENYEYKIIAKVTDQSRREIQGVKKVIVAKTEFQFTTNPEKYLYKPGQRVAIRVKATDFNDNPIQTKFNVYIRKKVFEFNTDFVEEIETLKGETNKDGLGYVYFDCDEAGIYTYAVKTRDKKGNFVYASSNFWVSDKDKNIYDIGGGVQIITDKEVYENTQEIELMVISPVKEAKALLTFESSEILDYEILNIKNYNSFYKIKLKEKIPILTKLNIAFFFENSYYSGLKKIVVVPKSKYLSLDIKASKDKYKPGEKGSLIIKVKDNNGNAVPNAEVSIGTTDESIYAIREEIQQNIKDYFYSVEDENYIYTRLPDIGYYYDDDDYNLKQQEGNYEKLLLNGSSKIYGVLVNDKNELPLSGYKVILRSGNHQAETETDKAGKFEFDKVPEGKYSLIFTVDDERFGYVSFQKSIKNIKVKKGEILDIGKINLILEERYHKRMRKTFYEADGVYEAQALAPTMDKAMNGGSAKERFVKAEIRSDFKDAIYWSPDVITDKKGEVEIEIKYPDNLTTWRSTVRVNTQDSKFGQDIFKTITRKELLLRMETPRVLHQNDEVIISTIVHNYLKETKMTKIEFSSQGANLISSLVNNRRDEGIIQYEMKNNAYFIKIPSNKECRIDWKIKVVDPNKNVTFKATAETDEESDGIEKTVPIKPFGVEMVVSDAFSLQKVNESNLSKIKIPDDVEIKNSMLTLKFAPSLAGTIFGALDELVAYPYGCVEQTMSRFLPAVIVANTMKKLNVELKSKTSKELPKVINAGLKRLYDYQHEDGGWGWWQNDQTNPYMTAYVMFGLYLTKNSDYEVDEEVFINGLSSLKELIFQKNLRDENNLAYMLYVLSVIDKDFLLSQKSKTMKLFDEMSDNENPYVISLLALAGNNLRYDKYSNLINRLKKSAKVEGLSAYWGSDKWSYQWHKDKVQTTSLAVRALLTSDGDADLIEKAIRWLVLKRTGAYWSSTLQTSMVILALNDYLIKTNELEPDFNVKINVNGKEVLTKKFTKKDVYENEISFILEGDQLKIGENTIEVIKDGEGKLYFTSYLKYYSKNKLRQPITDYFEIEREYYLVRTINEGNEYINTIKKIKGDVKSGDEIFVKLTLKTNDDREYFMLEEPIPAGCEVVQDGERKVLEQNTKRPVFDRPITNRFYGDKEIRDDRISFFMTYLPKGKTEFYYLLKAQIPGQYVILPSTGSLMYYPEVRGTSFIENLKIKD